LIGYFETFQLWIIELEADTSAMPWNSSFPFALQRGYWKGKENQQLTPATMGQLCCGLRSGRRMIWNFFGQSDRADFSVAETTYVSRSGSRKQGGKLNEGPNLLHYILRGFLSIKPLVDGWLMDKVI
jgi:hypothetical protein